MLLFLAVVKTCASFRKLVFIFVICKFLNIKDVCIIVFVVIIIFTASGKATLAYFRRTPAFAYHTTRHTTLAFIIVVVIVVVVIAIFFTLQIL
jgi:hypothetical protein